MQNLFGHLGKAGTDIFYMMKSPFKEDFLDHHIASE
jgi:hypothetical protein